MEGAFPAGARAEQEPPSPAPVLLSPWSRMLPVPRRSCQESTLSPCPILRSSPSTRQMLCKVFAVCGFQAKPSRELLMGEFSREPGKKRRERADVNFDVNLL